MEVCVGLFTSLPDYAQYAQPTASWHVDGGRQFLLKQLLVSEFQETGTQQNNVR